MLKSLFSGVSGLQSHQIAMDVESNNIANVNTVGFKYSRANFSDLLAQTKSIATAPQGELGGKNSVQVGLGATVSSMTRIFSQGSVQNSDKNTDMAIQGDGFFIISPDGGNTYKYTRSGDFKFDAGGNFVDNNGFIAQGWLRDSVTGAVDSTAPIENINIAPGLTTPANPSSEVVLKANLNSGNLVESFSPAYAVPSGTPPSKLTPPVYTGDALNAAGQPIASGNMGVMFNETGKGISLQDGQGVWMSWKTAEVYAPGPVEANAAAELNITFTLDDGTTKQITANGVAGNNAAQNASIFVSAINAQKSVTGVTAVYNAATNRINLSNDNSNASASHNINISSVSGSGAGFEVTSKNDQNHTAHKYTYSSTGSSDTVGEDKTFKTIADLRYAMELQARAVGDHDGVIPDTLGTGTLVFAMEDAAQAASSITIGGILIPLPVTTTGTAIDNADKYEEAITNAGLTDITATSDGAGNLTITNRQTGTVNLEFAGTTNGAFPNIPDAPNDTEDSAVGGAGITMLAAAKAGGTMSTADLATLSAAGAAAITASTFFINGVSVSVPAQVAAASPTASAQIYVDAIVAAGITGISARVGDDPLADDVDKVIITNTNSTPAYLITNNDVGQSGFPTGKTLEITARGGDLTANGAINESNIEISVDAQGKFLLTNPGGSPDGDYDINLKVTGFSSPDITENTRFTTSMAALNTSLPAGSTGKAFSQSFNAATHSSSIDIFDSLGSKHTLRMEFRKTELDKASGSKWDLLLSVPEPATISTTAPYNEYVGSVRFNNDGSLAVPDPSSISFSGNNGSSPEQQVNLSFGTANAFDGMTSFDSRSSTSGISQDGYTGGDLVGIRIDQSGTLVGSFSNGRSFGLAQVAMAKFTNNEGLGTEGGNIYTQSANSGDPIIGTAATAGRGFIQASALEASNVDLSRALTQLIIIQRGFQANGKTITTSDQLLQTLIGLKN